MSRDFDGTSGRLFSAATPITAVPLSFSAWVNLDALGGVILGILNQAAAWDGFFIGLDATNAYVSTVSNTVFAQGFKTAPSLTTWAHIAGVIASATSRIAYVNGSAGTEDVTNMTPASMASAGICIAASVQGAIIGNYVNGRIAEAAIWNVALAADEVLALSKGYAPRMVRPASLKAYWPILGNNSPDTEIIGRYEGVLTGTAPKFDHTRVLLPKRRQAFGIAAAVVPVADAVGRKVYHIPIKGPVVDQIGF